jgi:hypothetical protein
MPLRYLIIISLFLSNYSLAPFSWFRPSQKSEQRIITLMLDPAGDAQHTGRIIDTTFERGISIQCAHYLKQELERNNPNLRIILTRFPGETVQPLQNANFANRLKIDGYITIHFYHEKTTKPSLYIYYFCYENGVIPKNNDLAFYPYDKAYLNNLTTTQQWAQIFQKSIDITLYTQKINLAGIFGVPFKPLIGIQAPALALEIGLKKADDWPLYNDLLRAGIQSLVETIT